MNRRLVHFFVLFIALLMPFQVFSMAIVISKTSCVDVNHCKHMQKSDMGTHCNMHATQHSKQAPQKADCCQGGACAAICTGLMLPASMSALKLNGATDFSFFITPPFYSQSPDSLERPPRC